MSSFLNNGQRMPNIFERARAYENGDGGIIQPKKDGYKETYNKLTDDEKSFVFRHPGYALKFNANAEQFSKL